VRALPRELEAELRSGVTTLCLCWTITTTAGTVRCFTDHDRDLEFDGLRFPAASGLEPTAIEAALGLSVDNLEAQGALGAGGFDAAALQRGIMTGRQSRSIWSIGAIRRDASSSGAARWARSRAGARASPPRFAGSPTSSG
jgi:hypothetical protein